MITKENLNKAKEAYEKAVTKLNFLTISKDAYKAYMEEVQRGIWSVANLPDKGPFTIDQAKLISVNIDMDYAYPALFANSEIWNRAQSKLNDLDLEIEGVTKEVADKKKTYETLSDQYQEQVKKEEEESLSGPEKSVEVVTAKIEQGTELQKAKIRAEEQRRTNRLIAGTFISVLGLMIFGFVLAKVLK